MSKLNDARAESQHRAALAGADDRLRGKPSDPEALVERAEALCGLAFIAHYRALQGLRDAHRTEGDVSDQADEAGAEFGRRMRHVNALYGEAVEASSRAIATQPSESGGYVLKARALRGMMTEYWNSSEGVQLNHDREHERVALLENANRLNPSDPEILAELAGAHRDLGSVSNGTEARALYGRASEAYEGALTLRPEDANLRGSLVRSLVELAQAQDDYDAGAETFQEALAHLADAASRDPNSISTRGRTRTLLAMSEYQEKHGLLKQAVTTCREAIASAENEARVWEGGPPPWAANHPEILSLAMNVPIAKALLHLGDLLRNLSDVEGATHAYGRAMEKIEGILLVCEANGRQDLTARQLKETAQLRLAEVGGESG